jgi:multimeric flavodoxin WrbA
MTMRLIGLSCGPADGSSEILLKAALAAAEAEGVEVLHVRLADLRLSTAPIVLGPGGPDDDAPWFFDQLMESDGLIIAAPVLNRTIPGALKVLLDRLLGPKADAAFALEYRRMRDAGQAASVTFPCDERVLRPRVGGFLAVGGALTDRWKTFALPLMHHMTFSMQIGIADQVLFGGAGVPGAIALDETALARAARLGRNVAQQAGRGFDEVEFRGDPGLCPMCHLDVITLRGSAVECATCGAAGELVVDAGRAAVRFTPEGCAKSVLSIAEKHQHFLEVQETAARQFPRAAEIEERAAPHRAFDRLVAPGRPVAAG